MTIVRLCFPFKRENCFSFPNGTKRHHPHACLPRGALAATRTRRRRFPFAPVTATPRVESGGAPEVQPLVGVEMVQATVASDGGSPPSTPEQNTRQGGMSSLSPSEQTMVDGKKAQAAVNSAAKRKREEEAAARDQAEG